MLTLRGMSKCIDLFIDLFNKKYNNKYFIQKMSQLVVKT